ncbi:MULTISPECIES: hypothetical protein [Stenotrophomonas]|jgi:hypothetical protein|uniref:Outer membrane lipoprotein carrier protein LolA n=2 Tax=Stenotrophomonas TaxID=40323 RepID=A0AAI9FXG7_STEMA|nr:MULTISPECIES: hypothetical protein [Stenotrophomonas]AWT16334.1 hypothetical protein DM611_19595 [Stenotrophomonas maltophilia]EKT4094824.1 hypothetical protein [Stenotrophomonas maltophilia]ELF4102395.1 hypothetical protein [Stenotrophomonas maltophilia]MBA0287460.1 hypothetical protein [Stenotrophomonas maltophilia]MBA0325644.1 hypothetical protein [Stenotrophomonas maltophilia]
MRRLPALSLLACLLLAACDRTPAPASTEAPVPAADPAQAVLGASQRFAALRSFHAELEVLGAPQPVRSAMDFVAPDRFRVQTPAGPQTIIGDTMFLQADGAVRQVPTPPGLLEQWRNPLPADALPADLQAEDLGSQSLDGVETRHYRLRGAQPGERLEYWVDAQGLPRQIVRSGSSNGRSFQLRLRYSRFNDPALRVDLP